MVQVVQIDYRLELEDLLQIVQDTAAVRSLLAEMGLSQKVVVLVQVHRPEEV